MSPAFEHHEEGNRTTLADYIESEVEGRQEESDPLREIANIEAAMLYRWRERPTPRQASI